MARGTSVADRTILEMALVGYQVEIAKIDARIYEIKSLLKGRRSSLGTVETDHQPAKRNLSEAARHRIAAAQTKRWAEHRRLKAQAAKAE